MAKKSAASAKVMKPEFKDGKSTRDKFNEWKGVELFTMEVAIEQSRRIDTWVSRREDAKHFPVLLKKDQTFIGHITFHKYPIVYPLMA